MVTTHDPAPVQLPLHPVKDDPGAATGARVTTVPSLKSSVQSVGHEMPTGVLVTVPLPLPLGFTVKPNNVVKVAVTDSAWVNVTKQLPVPLHPPPLQPMKIDVGSTVAVSVTTVPFV